MDLSLTHILTIIGIILLVALVIYIIYRIKKDVDFITELRQFNLKKMGYTEMPAVPFSIPDTLETIIQLGLRTEECKMAKYGLSNEYKIGEGKKHSAFTYMYDDQTHDTSKEARKKLYKELEALAGEELFQDGKLEQWLENATPVRGEKGGHALTQRFLEKPEQFTISWTNYYDVYKNAHSKIDHYSNILKDAKVATDSFWPMIAENGLAYNLLFLKKVDVEVMKEIKANFGEEESQYLDEILREERLYSIDLRIFEKWGPQQVKGYDRWTPGSWILLEQDPGDKKLRPISVRISGPTDTTEARTYRRGHCSDSVWLFALTAARCSVTVYGIWLGHVYHWHVVTAAMQMTMFQNIKEDHPVRTLMDPQSKSLIGFNDTLFLLWDQIGPPTSFASTDLFLQLTNTFATGREFFDDDPNVAIENLGLDPKDFSVHEPWDRYPIVKDLLHFWKISGTFAHEFTIATYKTDQDVANDEELQAWMEASSDPDKGNVRGLPYLSSKEELTRVLTSLIYRVVVHGNSRLMNSLGDALSFVSNYPPCLQRTELPDHKDTVSTDTLLKYLPNTGTIGEMMTFYYIFIYSAPKDQLMPLFGNETSLYFKDPKDPRNKALVDFRYGVDSFLKKYKGGDNLRHQWPSSIET